MATTMASLHCTGNHGLLFLQRGGEKLFKREAVLPSLQWHSSQFLGGRAAKAFSLPSPGPQTARRLVALRADNVIEELDVPVKTSSVQKIKHVIEAQQFDRGLLEEVFLAAEKMETVERGSPEARLLDGYVMATIFYEPSTRTRLSFESAMKRLGGEVVTTENAREFSSASKGETLEDSVRILEGYADVIVLRHFESGAAKRAASVSSVPVINAGDGPGQHPTQALLDVYTIRKELGRLDNINVTFVGDLANGRTVRSLAYLLTKFSNVKFSFVAPDVVKMKDDIKDYLTRKSIPWEELSDLKEAVSKSDVIYQTRIQKERFGERIDDYEQARGKYIVNKSVMAAAKKDCILMHPLPRLDEISSDVDDDPRAAYFRQAKNGLFIRMALLKLLLRGL